MDIWIFNSNIPPNIDIIMTLDVTPCRFSFETWTRYVIIKYSYSLTHVYLWLIYHRFLALSGLRCLMMRHRFSSTFSQVWLSCIIESYIWHILSYASWILEWISCHIAYLWVTNPMLSSSMPIIKWALFLSFLILRS